MKSEITIVVPAFNEFENLSRLLHTWLEFCEIHNLKLLIVNDGSRDETKFFLNEAVKVHPQLQVIHHKINRGYGGALKSGIAASQTTFTVTIDADGQHCLDDILRMMENLKETDADMVVGNRGFGQDSMYRKIGKFIIRYMVKKVFPAIKLKDINSGMKLYRTDLVQRYLNLCPNGMAFSDIIALVFLKKYRKVVEIPIKIEKRVAGKSTINTVTALDTVWKIGIIVMMFNPIRIFFPLALSFWALGFLWGLKFFLNEEGITVGSAVLISLGFFSLAMGLISEILSLILLKENDNFIEIPKNT